MEQTPNQRTGSPFCKVKQPGGRQLAKGGPWPMAPTSVVLPDEAVPWRRERFHGAVIAHDGTEESAAQGDRGLWVEELTVSAGGSWARARIPCVAIMFDWQSYWSLEGCVGLTTGFNYPNEVHRFYRALWRRNVPVDAIASTTPLCAAQPV